jgi:hypothetical protein
MDIHRENVEQTVPARLYLTSFKDKFRLRTWMGHDWQMVNFLHEKGYSVGRNESGHWPDWDA